MSPEGFQESISRFAHAEVKNPAQSVFRFRQVGASAETAAASTSMCSPKVQGFLQNSEAPSHLFVCEARFCFFVGDPSLGGSDQNVEMKKAITPALIMRVPL